MKINPYKGLFVAIEGLDGSGSGRIASFLVKKLSQEQPITFVKEPSEGEIGRFIKTLLSKRGNEISPLMLEYLFAADRALLMKNRVIPALKDGRLVVADRYIWSSVAYRSLYYRPQWLMELNAEFFLPDLTFYIDTDPEICARNIYQGGDQLQIYTEEDKLYQVKGTYEWIAEKFGHCFTFVNGDRKDDEIIKFITKVIYQNLKNTDETRKFGRLD